MIRSELRDKSCREIREMVSQLPLDQGRLLIVEYLETLSSCFYEDGVEGTNFDCLMMDAFKAMHMGLQTATFQKFELEFLGCKR